MRARNFGRIINVSSIGGKCAFPLGGWYHASKFALEGYSDSLRMEVPPFGIDVIVVEPGGTESEWADIAAKESERYSGEGAYANLVHASQNSEVMKKKMPPAKVISDLVVKALRAKKPKTRYHGGYMAGQILAIRHLVSDRLYDRLIISQYK